jgi:transposase InsO family protein
VKYAWIQEQQKCNEFNVDAMCEALDVSRSRYYAHKNASPTLRQNEDERLTKLIIKSFYESDRNYGTERIQRDLRDWGENVSRRRIGRLMKKAGLVCKTIKKFKATTNSKHNESISPNLLNRNFKVDEPNQVWVGDITYIWTDMGWLYLATVIDLFSRKVVGWSISNRMKTSLVNDAMLMAIWQRKPPKGLIWHTDRGSQYASKEHRALLKKHHIQQSMSRKGDCWDNAVAESFFHTLKTELVFHERYKTREQAQASIFGYIEVFYNRKRRHSANNLMSPAKETVKNNFPN